MHAADSSNKKNSPATGLIGITMGCPVGIGPEIILRFLTERRFPEYFLPVVIGDVGVLERCAAALQIDCELVAWQPGKRVDNKKIHVLEPRKSEGYKLQPEKLKWGKPSPETGHAAVAYIMEAVHLVTQSVLDGMVTCPISKHALQLAGYTFPGHTEMIASLCGVRDFGMMMAGDRLKVSLVTIHLPLAKVAEQLKLPEIMRIIALTGETLRQDFGINNPRIAVAGFNPHGGESGMFGDEERRIIDPAVKAAVSEHWELAGPMPPDTVFKMTLDKRYDAVVAMYHDQGLIPFKLVHFEDGVNLTMGLPIVRTSVDHGTAYDIAGKGIASHASLAAAFAMAAAIIENRGKLDSDMH